MAHQPSQSDRDGDTGAGPAPESPPGMPGWVKVFALVILVLVLLVAIVSLSGLHTPPSGGHGPPVKHGVQQP